MYGNMMQTPLLIAALLRHADSYHGDTEIVSRLASGELHRYTYRDAHRRTHTRAARGPDRRSARGGEPGGVPHVRSMELTAARRANHLARRAGSDPE